MDEISYLEQLTCISKIQSKFMNFSFEAQNGKSLIFFRKRNLCVMMALFIGKQQQVGKYQLWSTHLN